MSNPQLLRPGTCVVSREDALRLDAYVQRVGGMRRAAIALKTGEPTLTNACEMGRMQTTTRDRIFAALDAAEAGQ